MQQSLVEQFKKQEKIFITEDIYYESMKAETLETCLNIILEGYLGEPGNPIMKHLKISREYLESVWRPILEDRLKNGFWDPLFYYKGKPAHFMCTQNLEDVFTQEKQFEDPIINFKYQMDKEICDEAKKMVQGKKSAYLIISSIKENSHPTMMTIASLETLAFSNLLGYDNIGGITYNKKSTSQVVKQQGDVFFIKDLDSYVLNGQKVFENAPPNLTAGYAAGRSDDISIQENKHALARREALKKIYGISDPTEKTQEN